MSTDSRESENKVVLNSLESDFVPAPIKEARDCQDEILTERFRGMPYAIADVGCGTGYHGSLFGPGCRVYHGYEIAPDIARIAENRWRQDGLDNTSLFLGDVCAAEPPIDFYDLVYCLYFYQHTGQHVITERGSRFVTTAENFWSVRWTEKSLFSNFAECGINISNILLHDLNSIAWLVEIQKKN